MILYGSKTVYKTVWDYVKELIQRCAHVAVEILSRLIHVFM